MEGWNSSIPLPVWSWLGNQVVLVFGQHALNALCEASASFMPHAPELRSHSRTFETLAFCKTKHMAERAAFGGTPVMCYDVLSSELPSKDVIAMLLKRFCDVGTCPHVWILNPHTQYEAQHGVTLYSVKEEQDNDFRVLEPLFGKRKREDLLRIMQRTNALPLEPFSPTWQIFDDDDDSIFNSMGH